MAYSAEYNRRHYVKNRSKILSRSYDWRKKNPEKWKAIKRRTLLKGYGIDILNYDEMLRAQNGLCAICKQDGKKSGRWKKLCVDHDHSTGEVRGLLCYKCNLAIGLLDDDIQLVEATMSYLTKRGGDYNG